MTRAPAAPRVPNIGPRGCAHRRLIGIVALALGVLALALLWALDAGRAPRLALFLPAWLGALGLGQARHRT
ncbi:MAG: hypothetical protein A2W08_11545 [Candidatus Rokubacteria bacterium RBG_16_73_20]|nr:MAG: hypothetical protein A2050_12285 [Candidatus Rokubacteria bacterium GWA2_73_35]OGK89530.1 MAG: hypothetical protein A2W08_11545 [Candidatus Rokubacteria bacterium RBG_16_73_20]